MIQVKITAIGNSAGVVLPKDVLAALGVQRGDLVQVDIEDGALRIVKVDDAYNRAIAAGRECFDRYPETLAALAR
jgi:putative addiction module antidote